MKEKIEGRKGGGRGGNGREGGRERMNRMAGKQNSAIRVRMKALLG